MREEGGKIASVEAAVKASRHEEAVPRSPDVLLACTDYLLRLLLPSIIFPTVQKDHSRDSVGLHAVADKRRSAEAAKDVFSAAAADNSNAPAAAGLVAASSAAASPGDNRKVVTTTGSCPRSAAGREEQQQQETAAAAAANPGPLCGVASSHLCCRCMCHRFIMEGPNREPILQYTSSATVETEEAEEPSGFSTEHTPQLSCVTSSFRPCGPAASSAATLSETAVAPAAVRAAVAAAAASGRYRGAAAARATGAAVAAEAACDAAGHGVYSFFADRLRALRQEAVVQQLLHRPLYFLLLLQSTRFHLFADVFWGGGLFKSSVHRSTKSTQTAAAAADSELETARLLQCMQQQQFRRASIPNEGLHIINEKGHQQHRAAAGAAAATGLVNSADNSNTTSSVKKYGKGAVGTRAPAAAAATLLQTVGFSASLNRLLLASCMQQLLNFIISKARRFFARRQRMHRQQMQQQQTRVQQQQTRLQHQQMHPQQQHPRLQQQQARPQQPQDPGSSTAAAPSVETDVHANDVWSEEISRREYSLEFYTFASVLQVQPQDVDEIVACALLYLLLPREDTPAQHQAVQLLLQQTASAFHIFWSECRRTQYAGRLILLGKEIGS